MLPQAARCGRANSVGGRITMPRSVVTTDIVAVALLGAAARSSNAAIPPSASAGSRTGFSARFAAIESQPREVR